MMEKNKRTVQSEPTGGFNDISAEDIDLPPPTTSLTTELGYINQVTEIVIKKAVNQEVVRREEPKLFTIEEKGTGEKLYKVYEDTKLCMQQSCGANRAFKLRLMDNLDRELILVERPYVTCDYCCGLTSCCDIVNVWVKNYKSVQFEWRRFGQIKQYWCPIFPYFSVRNAIGEQELTIRGPLLTFGCFRPTVFSIKKGSEVVGSITKEWTGICRRHTSDYDSFTLKFPPGIDEKLKVTLIGALFLIDCKFYETSRRCRCG